MATPSICAVDGCDKPAVNRHGWCNAHYLRWRRYGDPLAQRPRVIPNRLVAMEGRRFGLLVVESRDFSVPGEARWRCGCDCGEDVVSRGSTLRNGTTNSCGCLRSERARRGATRHGHAAPGRETAEYKARDSAVQRCTNPKSKSWPSYGGKGISVCERWRNSFEAFLQDMGPRPSPQHSLDRFPDRKGNYEPSNCRWATHAQQSANRDIAKGEQHGCARLTKYEVAEIRRERATGTGVRRLAQKYGVSSSHVYRILAGKLWAA